MKVPEMTIPKFDKENGWMLKEVGVERSRWVGEDWEKLEGGGGRLGCRNRERCVE